MQNAPSASPTVIAYRERLTPSLWILGSAAIVGPMAALTFTPVNAVVALAIGVAAAVGVIALLIVLSPVIEVRDGMLRAGRARMPVSLLGAAVATVGDDARHARGPGLVASAWHMIRGGIGGVVTVANADPADQVTAWVISSRTPDRLAAAITAAQR